MSGPNTQYDPVEVAALDPEAIDKAVQDALDAIAGAGDLEQLKSVRTAHQGDKSPLALANREIGALPPTAKAEARAEGRRRREQAAEKAPETVEQAPEAVEQAEPTEESATETAAQ